jgi:outer membrane receptor protein involved in Fe transport
VRWIIPKIRGEFQYGSAYLYAIRHAEQVQIYNPNAEVGEISRTISHLRAFDSMSGEKRWEINIDGFASGMQVTQNAIIVTSSQWANAPGIRSEQIPVRLIGISL